MTATRHKYQPPPWVAEYLDPTAYSNWLRGKAQGLVRRDEQRGGSHTVSEAKATTRTLLPLLVLLVGVQCQPAAAQLTRYETVCSVDGETYRKCYVESNSSAMVTGRPGWLIKATIDGQIGSIQKFWTDRGGHYIKNSLGKWRPVQLYCSFDEAGTYQNYTDDQGRILFSIRSECGE